MFFGCLFLMGWAFPQWPVVVVVVVVVNVVVVNVVVVNVVVVAVVVVVVVVFLKGPFSEFFPALRRGFCASDVPWSVRDVPSVVLGCAARQ